MQQVKNNISNQNSSGKQAQRTRVRIQPAPLGLQHSATGDAPLSFCFHIKQPLLHCGSVSCKGYPKVNILLQKRFTNVCTNCYCWVKKALQLLKDLQGSVLSSLSRVCPSLAVQDHNWLLDLSTQVTKFCQEEVRGFDIKWDLSKHDKSSQRQFWHLHTLLVLQKPE